MKLKANQTVHISSVGAESIRDGEIFEVNEGEGAELVKMGYASPVEDKAEPALANKMAEQPRNKSKRGSR